MGEPDFQQLSAALLEELAAEAEVGLPNGALDARVQRARELYGEMSEGERRENAEVAAHLGRMTRNRPVLHYQESDQDEMAAAMAALQGLEDLPLTPREGTRVYQGAREPEALLAYMGYPAFRPGQREAVQAALSGRDSMVVMPTGGGKSLCYQLPGLASPDLTVVVSPLIALMADQYRRLVTDGHPAVMLASGLAEELALQHLQDIRNGRARMVFCSPERFASGAFLRALESRRIDLFVIDEAHCLSEWGHDFRPDYLRLPQALARLGRPAVMACTATATHLVAEEIRSRLGMREPVEVRSGFDRPELSFDVQVIEGSGSQAAKLSVLQQCLQREEYRPAIVYCGTRKETESLSEQLRATGVSAAAYHAGLGADERASTQNRFMDSDLEVVCATNAFGMGVDKSNVRSVFHWCLPSSVEAYYQEAGRAGRDGRPARAILLGGKADLARLRRFNDQRSIEPNLVASYWIRLQREASDSRLEIAVPSNDEERLCLAIIERSGGCKVEPAGGGRLQVSLEARLNGQDVKAACAVAKDRGWAAYHAIKNYAFEPACRRQRLLAHFGDPGPGAPLGRCCDICDPEHGLPAPEASSARTGSGRKRAPSQPVQGVDVDLYTELVLWRRGAADGKPAYTVASNATLEQIAALKPGKPTELLAVKGVGPAFVNKHAREVLALVKRYA